MRYFLLHAAYQGSSFPRRLQIHNHRRKRSRDSDDNDDEGRAEAVVKAFAGPDTYKFYDEHKGVPHPTPLMEASLRAITVLLHEAGEREWPEESYVRGFKEGFIRAVKGQQRSEGDKNG